MLMDAYISGSSKMIKQMVSDFILITKEGIMMENGLMILEMDMVK